MKIAVIDDRAEDRKILGGYLERYMLGRSVAFQINCFESGEDFLNRFENKEYSLIMLDVFMQEGHADGTQIAERIREKDSAVTIIFSTSSPDFAIKGYMVKASGYLLKPYTYERFEETMDLVFEGLHSERRYIEVKEKKMMVRVLLSDIIYCDYDNHYIRIHTKNRIVRSYMPFRELSDMLLCYDQFLCCYRNIIINMELVQKMEAQDFMMINDERIPMRRQDKIELRQRYADFVFEKMNGGGRE